MGILIEFGLAAVLVALVAGAFMRGGRSRHSSERDDVTARRVEAYMATIRREGKNPELAAMSDAELRDLLLSGARNLRIDNERRMLVLAGGAVVGVLAAVMVATQDGLRGFGIALVVAAIVLYGLNEILVRRSREPLLIRGIDVERLRVE
jgi:hypothetical protein